MYSIIIIAMLLTLLSIFSPTSKVYFFLNMLVLTLVTGGYNGNVDLNFYIEQYNNESFKDFPFEGLYTLVSFFFHKSGIDFQTYHFILSAAAMLIIAFVIKETTEEAAFVSALLYGFSTVEYAPQIKTLLASSVLIYALYIRLYKERTIKNTIKYLMLVLIASGFHILSVFFLIFLLDEKIQPKHAVISAIASSVIIMVGRTLFFGKLLEYVPSFAFYFGRYRKNKVIIGMILWQITGILIANLLKKSICRENENYEDIVNRIYKYSLLFIFISPLYLLTTVANRFIRIWSPYYYLEASYSETLPFRVNYLRALMMLYSWGSFVLFYLILGQEQKIFLEIISNNIFFKI